MTENTHESHPSPERLAGWREGRLTPDEAVAVQRHHDGCPLCRLETRRQDRFATIADDVDLAAEAEWAKAEADLQRAYEVRVRPTFGRPRRRSSRSRRWWYAPAAAVAALLLFMVRAPREPAVPWPAPGDDAVRGDGTSTAITLVTPLLDVPSTPEFFRWHSSGQEEAFTLIVFSPSLETIARFTVAGRDSAAAPDSLRARLVPGVTYLWSVEGRRGLATVGVSANGWFRIALPKP